jgi:hypothetical protein
MGTTFGLHHILFPHPRLHGGKSWTSARTKVTYPPPGNLNMLEFLDLKKSKILPAGLRKKFRRQEAGTTGNFSLKMTHVFGHSPCKKKGGNTFFDGIFWFWYKKL